MFTRCVRKLSRHVSPQHARGRCGGPGSSNDDLDQVSTLLQLCVDRHYVSPGQTNGEWFRRGLGCCYGPLGVELRRNLLDQWWDSVSRSTAQVFGISTVCSSQHSGAHGQGRQKIVDLDSLKQILNQQELSKDQLIQEVHVLLERSASLRTNFLQGRVLYHILSQRFLTLSFT